MKRSAHQGWTLVELLVSMAVLGLLVLLMIHALDATQRSSQQVMRQARWQAQEVDVINALSQDLGRVAWPERQVFSASGEAIISADGHFVCGSARELLPDMNHVVGDALFFQHFNLHNELVCGGYFVQLNDEPSRVPRILEPTAHRTHHFCLMKWQPPAEQIAALTQGGAMSRDLLYRWFREGVRQADQCRLVANHVLMLQITTTPNQRCYDTRCHLWEGASVMADESRDRLPSRLHLVWHVVTEASWLRACKESESLSRKWLQIAAEDPGQGLQPSRADVLHRLAVLGLDARACDFSVQLGP